MGFRALIVRIALVFGGAILVLLVWSARSADAQTLEEPIVDVVPDPATEPVPVLDAIDVPLPVAGTVAADTEGLASSAGREIDRLTTPLLPPITPLLPPTTPLVPPTTPLVQSVTELTPPLATGIDEVTKGPRPLAPVGPEPDGGSARPAGSVPAVAAHAAGPGTDAGRLTATRGAAAPEPPAPPAALSGGATTDSRGGGGPDLGFFVLALLWALVLGARPRETLDWPPGVRLLQPLARPD